MTPTAAARWSASLAAWEVDPEILAAAPESPWGYPVELFAPRPAGEFSRTLDAAREALPPGGSVLDVGCGAGNASVELADGAGRLTGVDESESMLLAYRENAAQCTDRTRTVVHTVQDRWPDCAESVQAADVVVAANVVYNVPDLEPFLMALHTRAGRRVVLELAIAHPQIAIGPLWRHFHGQDRPDGPRLADLMAVLGELDLRPVVWRWARPSRFAHADPTVLTAWLRRRLCLPYEREPEVAALTQGRVDPTTQLATVWWDTA